MAGKLSYEELRSLLEEFDDFFPTKLSSVVDLGYYSELLGECYTTILKGNGERAGFVSAYFDEKTRRASLYFIVLKEKYRGRGLEDKLIKHMERLLCEKNCDEIKVEVKYKDRENIDFYDKHGYTFAHSASEMTFYMSKKLA